MGMFDYVRIDRRMFGRWASAAQLPDSVEWQAKIGCELEQYSINWQGGLSWNGAREGEFSTTKFCPWPRKASEFTMEALAKDGPRIDVLDLHGSPPGQKPGEYLHWTVRARMRDGVVDGFVLRRHWAEGREFRDEAFGPFRRREIPEGPSHPDGDVEYVVDPDPMVYRNDDDGLEMEITFSDGVRRAVAFAGMDGDERLVLESAAEWFGLEVEDVDHIDRSTPESKRTFFADMARAVAGPRKMYPRLVPKGSSAADFRVDAAELELGRGEEMRREMQRLSEEEMRRKSVSDEAIRDLRESLGLESGEFEIQPLVYNLTPPAPNPETVDNFWDCECVEDYIHHESCTRCRLCGAESDDRPNSHKGEVGDALAAAPFVKLRSPANTKRPLYLDVSGNRNVWRSDEEHASIFSWIQSEPYARAGAVREPVDSSEIFQP
jgi:hypothetical protein